MQRDLEILTKLIFVCDYNNIAEIRQVQVVSISEGFIAMAKSLPSRDFTT